MTKSELIDNIIFNLNLTNLSDKRLVESIVDDIFNILAKKIINDGKVLISSFGSFHIVFFKNLPRVAFLQSSRFTQLLKNHLEKQS